MLLLPPFRRVAVAWDVLGSWYWPFWWSLETKLFCGPRECLQRLLGLFFVFLGAVIIIGGLSPYVDVA